MTNLVTDAHLAHMLARRWLRDSDLRPLADAMNSSAWEVESRGERYVIKVSGLGNQPGLHAAACLERRGVRTGAPIRTARQEGRLVALLRFVEGQPLAASEVRPIGRRLGQVHRLLASCAVPDGLVRWPWAWLDVDVIDDPGLRSAAATAIHHAERLAPTLTHGILHGDVAPAAFRRAGDDIGLIDWGAACHGPLLYDVASAWMYSDEGVVTAYASTGPLDLDELAHARDFVAFRWAVQAWYFSTRLATGDLTGISSAAENEKGLADARRALVPNR